MPTQGTTKLAQMLDPQVLADMIQAEVGKAIRFAPLAEVDSTLQGRPGSTLTVPKWDYIGDAEDVAEGEAIPMTQLGKTQTTMTIKKAGKGVEITDEAILSGYGDPVGEAARQIAESINHKVDNDVLKALQGATQTFAAAKGLSVENVHKAMDIFNDEDDEDMVLLCSPARASELRMNAAKKFMMGSELGANAIIKGTYGEVLGVQIVRSRKCAENEAYLIKKGALKIMLKRETMVETERKVTQGINVIVANKHYGTYLYKAEKAVKLNITGKVPDKDDVVTG